MKRTFSLMLAILLVLGVFCLTGCHGSTRKAMFQVPEYFDTQRNYTVTFWAKNDTNKTQVNIYNETIERFEKLYPNITVNVRFYTNYIDIYNDVINNIATHTTPDVCITYPDHIATYITGSNTVVPLDSLFENEKYGLGGSELKFDSPSKDDIVTEFLDEGIIDGKYYDIPFMRSTEACYINKTYVEKLGYEVPDILTWDFIWEVSEAATKKNADGTFKLNNQKVLIPFIYKSTDNMMITMLRQLGAGYSTSSGEIEVFNESTASVLTEIASHAKTGAFSTFKISSYPANFLNAGQCIFAIDSTAGATWMGSDAPLCDIAEDKIVKFETAVRPVPQYDTENPLMISQGPSICIFNNEDSQQVLASWLFAQFLLTDETQTAYAQTEGYVPVTRKAQSSSDYMKYLENSGKDNNKHYKIKIEASKLLIENTANTFTTPVFNGSTSLREAAGQMIESVTKSERRKETVDEAYIQKLYSEMKSLYRLDSISAGGKAELGELPGGAKALLITLACVWVLIIAYVISDKAKGKKNKQ